VLEHAVWSFLVTGVSRSFTHELVRHRHFSYSQLSQRYVNESESPYVEPDVIAADPALHAVWERGRERGARRLRPPGGGARTALRERTRRDAASQAGTAGGALGAANATETRIFVTGNARALRHFIEMRGSEAADVEIRKVALQVLEIMRRESPHLFSDYELAPLADGSQAVRTAHPKV